MRRSTPVNNKGLGSSCLGFLRHLCRLVFGLYGLSLESVEKPLASKAKATGILKGFS